MQNYITKFCAHLVFGLIHRIILCICHRNSEATRECLRRNGNKKLGGRVTKAGYTTDIQGDGLPMTLLNTTAVKLEKKLSTKV